MSPSTTAAQIKKTPGVCGGDACVGNRRITIWMLVEARQHGFTDEELLTRYQPPMTLDELAAAWRYYERNREEIDEAIRLNADDE